jgi:hypothetical protein
MNGIQTASYPQIPIFGDSTNSGTSSTMTTASSTVFSLLIALIGIPALLSAQEISLPEYRVKLTLPKGWSQREKSPGDGPVLSAANTTGQAASLFIMDIPKYVVTADTGFTNQVEHGIVERGVTITERKQITVGGVPAYSVRGRGEIDSTPVKVYVVFAVANGHGYSFTFTSTTDDEPSANAEVQSIIRSFKFIGKPEKHVAPADMPSKKIALRQQKFSITLPGGWEQVPRDSTKSAELIFEASDFTHARLVNVELRPKVPIGIRDTALVSAVRESLKSSGITVSDHGYTKVAGNDALWLHGTLAAMNISVQTFVVPANDKIYVISTALRGGGDAANDAVLQKVVGSVGFGGK